MSNDIVKRLRERPLRGGRESNDEFAIRRQKEHEDGADLIEAQAKRIAELEAALRFANEYVGRLAFTLAEKHYPEQRLELLPDLLGRIDQIDNMTCGLHRAALAGGKDE